MPSKLNICYLCNNILTLKETFRPGSKSEINWDCLKICFSEGGRQTDCELVKKVNRSHVTMDLHLELTDLLRKL